MSGIVYLTILPLLSLESFGKEINISEEQIVLINEHQASHVFQGTIFSSALPIQAGALMARHQSSNRALALASLKWM